jgi:hypothetical protein
MDSDLQKSLRPSASPPSLAKLPARLLSLLRREVCLEITRSKIEDALVQVRAQAKVLKSTRPPFLLFVPKDTRNVFQERSAGASESEAVLSGGLQKVIAAQSKVKTWVEDDLETFVRETQPSYLLGLATRDFPDDWRRILLRLDWRVADFTKALGAVQVALNVMPNGMVLGANAGAFECLMPARQWATLLDYEFSFFNRLADMQKRSVALGSDTLKRVPERQFGPAVTQWARLEAEPARRGLAELRSSLEVTVTKARGVYAAEAAMVARSGARSLSYVYSFGEALRQLMRLEINPETIDAIVAETEQMVLSAD